MRLQNIRFPEPDICREEELYFHRRGEWIDFDGYFNLFYIEKRKKFTNQETLTLHLKVRDCRALRLMWNQTVLQEIALQETEEALTLTFPYPETASGVFWFSVKTEANVGAPQEKLSGWYEGECRSEKPVRIAAVVCTFKREPYILRNLKNILQFLAKPENAEMKLCYWLVDNGRTLAEHEEISRLVQAHPDVIRIIPNKNVGGAGGFTRGMMEAVCEKEQLGLTHVQMMDDDAVMDPEVFVRAYGFLSMRKDEWADITLGGSLWREDFPYIQQAAGEWFSDFVVQNDFPLADLRKTETCTAPYMCEAEHAYTPYSGWWCCCMSLNVVRADNLPIPLFLHHDDIEFGIRNQKHGIVFLNGFGVWHKGFELTFPGVNTYYDVRNTLITTALTQPEKSRREIVKWLWKRITAAVIEFRYEEMQFVYQAVRDFCRGPEWLYQLDSEKRNNQLRQQVRMVPLEKLQDELSAKDFARVSHYVENYKNSYDIARIKHYFSPERKKAQTIKKITFNGWLLPPKKGVIALSPVDAPFKAYRRKKIVLFEAFSGKAMVGERKYACLVKAIKYYILVYKLLGRPYSKAAGDYRSRISEFTQMDAWNRYLNR